MMNLLVFVTAGCMLSLMAEVNGTFYFEIGKGARLEEENAERSERNPDSPVLKSGLYQCKTDENVTTCKSLSSWQKISAYYRNNFFIVSNSELKPGAILKFDDQDVVDPPEIMVVGFDPKNIHSPDLMTYELCSVTSSDVVRALVAEQFVPNEPDTVQALSEYFCCNDVFGCILNDPNNARERYLPAVRKVMTACIDQYKGKIRPNLKMRTKDTPFTPFIRTASRKQASPDMNKLQTVMEVMLNKMIDPCILYKSADEDEKSDVNFTCQVYCHFLSMSAEIMGPAIAVGCNYLNTGRCVKGVCTCRNFIDVPMMYCNNKFRRESSTIAQCI